MVLTKNAKKKLREIDLDLQTVFGNHKNKPLATAQSSIQIMTKIEWEKAINEFMLPARDKFELVVTSHSFRINYVTKLLSSVPLQRVKKIVGGKKIKTTERYDRYVVIKSEVGEIVNVALNHNHVN